MSCHASPHTLPSLRPVKQAASPYGYTPLGRLLKEYRTLSPRYQRLVVFPEIASWQTSKGEVIRVSEIRDVIIPENRICTLEQAEVYYEGGGKFYGRNEKAGKCKK